MKGAGMSILREPYDPTWANFFKERTSIYPKHYMKIQTGKTKVNPFLITPAALLASSIALSFVWWPILFINIITLIMWITLPVTRPIAQRTETYVLANEMNVYKTRYAPTIDISAANKNSIYKDAVDEWIDAVRQTGDPGINERDWQKYLDQSKQLAQQSNGAKPDFEKLKIMRELMKGQ